MSKLKEMTVKELLHRVSQGQIVTFYKIPDFGRYSLGIEIRNCSGNVEETIIRGELSPELVSSLDNIELKLEQLVTNLAISDQLHNQKHNE